MKERRRLRRIGGAAMPGRERSWLRRIVLPHHEGSMPLWCVFPVIFAALYGTHWGLLNLPYFWDEAGYYIPAAWDFLRTGSLIPLTTISNAHPPLPSVYLALWWRLGGFTPQVTREAMLMVASFGLLGVWRLAMRLNGSAKVAAWTMVLTALYPVWFVQSTLAHADLMAAAATIWALTYALPSEEDASKPRMALTAPTAAVWFSVAVLAKETALATPLALAAFEAAAALRTREGAVRREHWQRAGWNAVCVAPLAAWYGYHFAKTGFVFGNPEFLRYNATATLTPVRFLAALGHRVLHLTAHMNLFVPVLLMAAAMMLDPVRESVREPGHDGYDSLHSGMDLRAQWRIYAVLAANAVAFSLLGGALLTRYLLAMYPLVLLVAVSTFHRRTKWWQAMAALSAVAFVLGIFVDPPYGFAPEDNLSYARMVRVQQAAAQELQAKYPGAVVLTAWPATDELTRPELGYVQKPFAVDRVEDFSLAQMDRAAEDPGGYSVALVFSTKLEPHGLPFGLDSVVDSAGMEERYFGLHHDLSAAVVAERLHGTVVWARRDGLEWAAIVHFDRAVDARVDEPEGKGRSAERQTGSGL